MPEVGEYWYCAHGSAEVVRIVAADDEECSFVVVNSFVRPSFSIDGGRLREATIEDFLHDYEESPDVSQEWLEQGSIWFARQDVNSRVVLEESIDEDDDIVVFRELRAGGVGRVQRLERASFTQQYVLTEEDDHDHLTDERFWVMGAGICAPFMSRVDAQAFLYETSALLNQSESSLRIHSAPAGHTPFARAVTSGVGGSAATPVGGGAAGRNDGSSAMLIATYGGGAGAAAGGTGGAGGWPGNDGMSTVVSGFGGFGIARAPEPESQTLWERLTAPDD